MDISPDTYPYTREEWTIRVIAEREAQPYYTDLSLRDLATPTELRRARIAIDILHSLDAWVHERLGTPHDQRALATPLEFVSYSYTATDELIEWR